LEVSELAIPGMNASFQGEFAVQNSKDLAVSLTVTAASLDLARVFPFIPMKIISPRDRRNLIEAGLEGRILVRGGAWSGRIRGLPERPRLEGSLALAAVMDNVSGFAPGLGAKISNASGGIDLNQDEARFTDVSLTLGDSPMVLNGWVNNLRGDPICSLFISLAATGRDLDPLLRTLSALGPTPEWIKRIHDPVGALSIKLRVAGPTASPGLRGSIELEDFGCEIKGLAPPLKDIQGLVRFEEEGVSESRVKGKIGSSVFEASGSAAPRNMDLTVTGSMAPRDLKRLDLLPRNLFIKGRAAVKVELKGDIQKLQFFAGLNLHRNFVSYSSYIRKVGGVPLKLEASGVYQADLIKIEEAYIIAKNTRISARGKLDPENRALEMIAHLPPRGTPTGILRDFTHPELDLKSGGRIDGNASIKYEPGTGKGLTMDADILLNYVSAYLPIFYKPVRGFTGRLRIRGHNLSLKWEQSSVGDSELKGKLFIRNLRRPRISGSIELPKMVFSDFTAPPGYQFQETWREWLQKNRAVRFLASSAGEIDLMVREGIYYDHKFSNLEAELKFTDGIAQIKDWSAQVARGDLEGNAKLNINRDSRTPLKIDFQGQSMSLATLLLTDPERVSVKGVTRAKGAIEWRLTEDSSVNNGLYSAGKVYMMARDGIIYRFQILSKIFSLLNLGSILQGRLPDILAQGLPYQTMSWRMDIFNDKWKINDFDLVSDAARITASGMYITSEDRVDFLVKVAPLVGFDKIFSGIFGNLITKDGKILTTTFRVRGLSGSPDVRLESTEPFGIKP
jgi:hypothetical protein